MAESIAQFSMAKGELAPSLYDRVDLQWWSSALKTCRNFVTQPFGGVKNRTGSTFCAVAAVPSSKVLLLPFRFSTTQSYALEFGDLYVRPIYRGSTVTYASAAAWTTATIYAVGTRVTQAGSLYRCLSAHTSGVFADDLTSAKWRLVGVVGAVVTVPSPYTAAEVAALQHCQSADVLTIVHPNHPPMNLSRYGHDDWVFDNVEVSKGPWLELNTDTTSALYVNQVAGTNITVTASKSVFVASNVGQLLYIEQRNYGQPWEPGKSVSTNDIRRSDGKYYKAVAYGTTGTMRPTHFMGTWSDGGVDWHYEHNGFGVVRITSVAADGKSCTADVLSQLPDTLKIVSLSAPKTIDGLVNQSGLLGLTITAHGFTTSGTAKLALTYRDGDLNFHEVLGTYSYAVVDANTLSLFEEPYPVSGVDLFYGGTLTQITSTEAAAAAAASFRWKLGAWAGDQGYPATVTYHQGRRVYGNTPTQPHTQWLSRTDAYTDFNPSSPLQDDDPVTNTLVSGQLNEVKAMLSVDKLLVLTAGAEWVIGSGQSDVLTYANFAPRVQGYRGASSLQPLGVADVALYVQDKGQVVRDIGFNLAEDRYTGADLTVFANHLVENRTITGWTYQQHPFGIVWMVRDDGVLLGLTYMRDQQVIGWHRHDTDGFYESVVCISEDTEDAVYVVVRRVVNGATTRYIERFATRLLADLPAGVFLDASVQFDNRNTSGTQLTFTSVSGGWDDQDTTVVVTSSAPIFVYPGTSDYGDQLVLTDGDQIYRATVVVTTSTTTAQVRLNRTWPVIYRNLAQATWAWARDHYTGLGHLEGKTIGVQADGFDAGAYVVTGGAITLSQPAIRGCIGLPYLADLETLSLNTAQQSLADKKKAINALRVKVLETQGLWAGRTLSDDDLYQYAPRISQSYDAPVRQQDGLVEIHFTTPWSTDGSCAIRQKAPLPVTITSIIPEVQLGGV